MKHDFIYLDWNVVKALKDYNVDSLFLKKIERLKKQYIIPFSFAHLCDRQKKMNEKTIKFINEDLNFFNDLSNGYMLGRYKDDYDITHMNIFEKFNEVTIAKNEQYPSLSIPEEILNKIKIIGFQKFFEDKKNVQWFPLIIVSALNRFESDYELYEQFREVFKLNPPEELSFFSVLLKPDLTSEELKKVIEKYTKDNQPVDNSLRHKVSTAYLLLDLNPNYHEKVNSKSNFTNMYTDSDHMLNASFAKCYITEDKKTIKKTRFIYQSYGIKTEVYNIEEFIKEAKL